MWFLHIKKINEKKAVSTVGTVGPIMVILESYTIYDCCDDILLYHTYLGISGSINFSSIRPLNVYDSLSNRFHL